MKRQKSCFKEANKMVCNQCSEKVVSADGTNTIETTLEEGEGCDNCKDWRPYGSDVRVG